MKILKKLITPVLAATFFMTTSSHAQTTSPSPWRLGIGVEGGLPTGDMTLLSKTVIGGTVRLQYGVDKGVAFTLTSGYYNFFAKSGVYKTLGYNSTGFIEVPATDQGVIPVKAGIKAYVLPGLFFGAEAGAGFETSYAKNTELILSPGIGYSTRKWDTSVRFEGFLGQGGGYGMVNLRVAYGFSL